MNWLHKPPESKGAIVSTGLVSERTVKKRRRPVAAPVQLAKCGKKKT